MYGIIVYSKEDAFRNESYIKWYIDEFEKRKIKLELVYDSDIDYNNHPDFAIVRTINPKLTKKIEQMGVRCFNNYKVSYITNDKALCYKYVSNKGIEIMQTYYNIDDVNNFPVVIKPKNSHGGDRVIMCATRDELLSKLYLYENNNYVVQSAASDAGKDVRVYVIGKKIIIAMLRQSDNDFRSNFCLGGRAQVYNLSDDEIKIINNIINIFDFDFVGIDFVFNNGKIVFNEIEDVVGSRMIYTYTDIDIVKLYADYITDELKEKK